MTPPKPDASREKDSKYEEQFAKELEEYWEHMENHAIRQL